MDAWTYMMYVHAGIPIDRSRGSAHHRHQASSIHQQFSAGRYSSRTLSIESSSQFQHSKASIIGRSAESCNFEPGRTQDNRSIFGLSHPTDRRDLESQSLKSLNCTFKCIIIDSKVTSRHIVAVAVVHMRPPDIRILVQSKTMTWP